MLDQNSLFEMISGIARTHAESYTELLPCASIFSCEHRRSYHIGDKVIVIDGKLVNSQGKPETHEIVKLEGTLQDTKHVFTVKDLSTNEVKTIEL